MPGVALLLLSLAGCSRSETPDGGNGPNILVTPTSLEYGRLFNGEEQVRRFTVENVGDGQLEVSDIVIGAGPAFTVLSSGTFDLQPGERTVIDVSFTPMADDNFGQALVLSNDPDTPEATVDLLGHGAVPDLVITPASYSFGEAPIPCETTRRSTGAQRGQRGPGDHRPGVHLGRRAVGPRPRMDRAAPDPGAGTVHAARGCVRPHQRRIRHRDSSRSSPTTPPASRSPTSTVKGSTSRRPPSSSSGLTCPPPSTSSSSSISPARCPITKRTSATASPHSWTSCRRSPTGR